MPIRTIHSEHHHVGWDNALAPVVKIEPGTELEFDILDASGGQLDASSTSADVANLDFGKVNPVTGPIAIDGARPGDALVVDLLGFEGSGWGWTALIPGFGLLAEDFPDPFLHVSRYAGNSIEFAPGIVLLHRPFTGTIGVAPAEAGQHSVVPPRNVGGNMDIRDLVEGATLRLPVAVPGALFSVGDTHAAQGDGEVCGTAIESPMKVRLRFDVDRKRRLARPQFDLPDEATRTSPGGFHATTGIAPDLMDAARDAVRDMIDHLGREFDMSPALAYCLCSVAVDLKISELVDAPNWVVSAYLPKGIFV